jgi:hypothetical protein
LTFSRGPRRFLAMAPEGFEAQFLPVLWSLAPAPGSALLVGDRLAPWKRQREYLDACSVLEKHLQDPSTNIESLCAVLGRIASGLPRA